MQEKIILWLAALAGVIASFWVLPWVNKQDEYRNESVARYEACIEAQYGTTPAHYRLEHGDYPECNSN